MRILVGGRSFIVLPYILEEVYTCVSLSSISLIMLDHLLAFRPHSPGLQPCIPAGVRGTVRTVRDVETPAEAIVTSHINDFQTEAVSIAQATEIVAGERHVGLEVGLVI